MWPRLLLLLLSRLLDLSVLIVASRSRPFRFCWVPTRKFVLQRKRMLLLVKDRCLRLQLLSQALEEVWTCCRFFFSCCSHFSLPGPPAPPPPASPAASGGPPPPGGPAKAGPMCPDCGEQQPSFSVLLGAHKKVCSAKKEEDGGSAPTPPVAAAAGPPPPPPPPPPGPSSGAPPPPPAAPAKAAGPVCPDCGQVQPSFSVLLGAHKKVCSAKAEADSSASVSVSALAGGRCLYCALIWLLCNLFLKRTDSIP
jgi:hypothetical protein